MGATWSMWYGPVSAMSDDKAQQFRAAVENNEYAEYELSDGFVLVTDEMMAGGFYPYIAPSKGHSPDGGECTGSDCEAIEALEEELNEIVLFDDVEWEDTTEMYVPYEVSLVE